MEWSLESSRVSVSASSGGPGLARTSCTSTPTNLGREGVKVWRTSLTRLVHALAHGAVLAWSGVMEGRSADDEDRAGGAEADERCLHEEQARAKQQREKAATPAREGWEIIISKL